jgi:alpha-tubulin suppressor-like RCC1 family protein
VRKIIFVCAVILAALSIPQVAGASPQMVQHWGSFTGVASQNSGAILSPQAVTIPDSANVVQIASSNSDQYALTSDGKVWAWGGGWAGELGNGGNQSSMTPVQVQFPAGVAIAALPTDVMPFDTGLALDTQGNAWGWGFNKDGELCMGNKKMYRMPVQLPFSNVTLLAGAGAHATYDAAGTLYACGLGRNGELGTGNNADSTTPVQVANLNGANVTALTASYANAGALMANGNYYDWGYGADGNNGGGNNSDSSTPVLVSLPAQVSLVALGGDLYGDGQTLAVLANGQMWAWGSDAHGQLGDGGTANQNSPERIPLPGSVSSIMAIASSGTTSYAVSNDGGVWSWGNGADGQIGNGQQQDSGPVKVATGATWVSATAHDVVIGG